MNEEVATAAAEGALTRAPADIAVAVTGVLGPEPNEDGNPVGRVRVCCVSLPMLHENLGRHDPDVLRHKTVTLALELLARTLTADKEK